VKRFDEASEWGNAIRASARFLRAEQRVRPGPDKQRTNEDRSSAVERASPRHRLEVVHVCDDKTASMRRIDIDLAARRRREVAEIDRRLALKTRATLRNERHACPRGVGQDGDAG
jgi:hypothetical protein